MTIAWKALFFALALATALATQPPPACSDGATAAHNARLNSVGGAVKTFFF